ncbi:MAG: iron ABC transporter permease [Flavobacteriales bacterium]|nr:iron ABC transporter permease [Flavobacteriales bacterium]
MHRGRLWPYLLLSLLGVLLFALHLMFGSVRIPLTEVWAALGGGTVDDGSRVIVRAMRFPGAVTAMLAGAGLAASGLLMQTLFRNPLAGPSVLGINSGASLGVALVMLAQPVWMRIAWAQDLAPWLGALSGAAVVLSLIVLADRRVGDGITLLIVGLMIGYLCSALISVLQVASPAAALKGFVIWGMGSFGGVDPGRLPWLAWPVMLGLVASLMLMKPLNALLLGEEQAATLGVRVPALRLGIIVVTGVLAGSITAFCGPIAFLGLATPHVARGLFRTNDHARLLPATILCGAVLALMADLVARLPGAAEALPLNAVTSLFGVPVVVWVLLRGRRWTSA